MEITFVRHAESTSNVAGRWQGQGDAGLSQRGGEQARALARRLEPERFDRLIASDLARAADTARAIGHSVELDPAWREIDVGAWEGLTREQVIDQFPEQVEAVRRGEDLRIGGGESWSEVFERTRQALWRLRERLGPDDRALVVSHGGVIHGLVAGVLGLRHRHPRPIGRLANTGVTTLRFHDHGSAELARYNDATHLTPLGPWASERLEAGHAIIALIAHETSDSGPASAPFEHVARWYDRFHHVYATKTPGAERVASVLCQPLGLSPRAPLLDTDSLGQAVHMLAERHGGSRVGLIAERGDIAHYAGSVLGSRRGLTTETRVEPPRRAGICHVVVTSRGEAFADYNVTRD